MRIAIISDSHDNLPNIYKALEWMNKNGVQEIIHCGDVCSPAALREIAKNFKGTIHLAYGNVDGDHEGMERMRDEFGNIIVCGEIGELEIGKLEIGNWKLGKYGKEGGEGQDGKEGDRDKFQISKKYQKSNFKREKRERGVDKGCVLPFSSRGERFGRIWKI
ncbi:MAG: metallophosphoesterase family protein [bacterium]